LEVDEFYGIGNRCRYNPCDEVLPLRLALAVQDIEAVVPELAIEIERLRTHIAAMPSAISGYVAAELTSVSAEMSDSRSTPEDKLHLIGERETLLRFQRNAEDIVAYAATAKPEVDR
jgi:hypothetical protein